MAIDTKEGSIPERYDVASVDNRDYRTTWLWIGRDYVEVDPVDLFTNMIDNCEYVLVKEGTFTPDMIKLIRSMLDRL